MHPLHVDQRAHDFEGEFYRFRDAILWPKPVQKPHPPIIVGGGGKGLLRIAAKHADYVNIIPGAGKRGHVSMEDVRKMTDAAYRERVSFVREEAKRHGVGVIVIETLDDYETWDERTEAVRTEPAPERLNDFIAVQLTEGAKQEIVQWFK